MTDSRQRAILRASTNELLLVIHASQKERAKRITGRWWDPERICWVYPKTKVAYNLIVTEFGNDLEVDISASKMVFQEDPKVQKVPLTASNVEGKSERICQECGNAIELIRLEIIPDAMICALCQKTKDPSDYHKKDPSEQWFPRSDSWVSKANGRYRR